MIKIEMTFFSGLCFSERRWDWSCVTCETSATVMIRLPCLMRIILRGRGGVRKLRIIIIEFLILLALSLSSSW